MSKFEYVLVGIFFLWLMFFVPIIVLIAKIADYGEHLLAIKILLIYSLVGIVDLFIIGYLKGDSSNGN